MRGRSVSGTASKPRPCRSNLAREERRVGGSALPPLLPHPILGLRFAFFFFFLFPPPLVVPPYIGAGTHLQRVRFRSVTSGRKSLYASVSGVVWSGRAECVSGVV